MRAWANLRTMRLVALAAILAACDPGVVPLRDEPPPSHALGMNDVTMLVPLPVDPAVPVVTKLDFNNDTMVARATFIAFVIAADMAPKSGEQLAMDDYHVVAIRFDLCDRKIEPCKPSEDGRLRLVLQPVFRRDEKTLAHDIGVHLFFRIPADELAGVVQELRRLAELQDAPLDAPLTVNPALAAGDEEYTMRLRALVETYAVRDKLMRFTTLGQERNSGAFAWVARGMERHADQLVQFPIPEMGLVNFKQTIQVGSGDIIYDVRPLAPTAAAPALNGLIWPTATADEKVAALDALEALNNPLKRSADDAQCMGCHIATILVDHRATTSGIDRTALASKFTSRHDTRVGGIILQDARVVRGLGWAASFPTISQRAANETAVVVDEIEQRYPVFEP